MTRRPTRREVAIDVRLDLLMVIIVLTASVIAVALTYAASAHQRWLREPLPAFPSRVSASLAAAVALKGWTELLGPAHGAFAWLTTALLAAILLAHAALLRRAG